MLAELSTVNVAAIVVIGTCVLLMCLYEYGKRPAPRTFEEDTCAAMCGSDCMCPICTKDREDCIDNSPPTPPTLTTTELLISSMNYACSDAPAVSILLQPKSDGIATITEVSKVSTYPELREPDISIPTEGMVTRNEAYGPNSDYHERQGRLPGVVMSVAEIQARIGEHAKYLERSEQEYLEARRQFLSETRVLYAAKISLELKIKIKEEAAKTIDDILAVDPSYLLSQGMSVEEIKSEVIEKAIDNWIEAAALQAWERHEAEKKKELLGTGVHSSRFQQSYEAFKFDHEAPSGIPGQS